MSEPTSGIVIASVLNTNIMKDLLPKRRYRTAAVQGVNATRFEEGAVQLKLPRRAL